MDDSRNINRLFAAIADDIKAAVLEGDKKKALRIIETARKMPGINQARLNVLDRMRARIERPAGMSDIEELQTMLDRPSPEK